MPGGTFMLARALWLRHCELGVGSMLEIDEFLEAMNDRAEKIAARFAAGLGNSRSEVVQVLGAIDHPASYYAFLPADVRQQIKADWFALAKRLGVRTGRCSRVSDAKVERTFKLPNEVLVFFGDASCVAHRPLAANVLAEGAYRMGWDKAAGMRYIQLNPPQMQYWLLFDCDHTDIDRWRASLPPPSYLAINPEHDKRPGRFHLAYQLSAPVCTSGNGREGPVRYLRAVTETMRDALGADPAYAGLMTKNPLHPYWRIVREPVLPSYSLASLVEGLELRWPKKPSYSRDLSIQNLSEIAEGGRNRALFDHVRMWAYTNSFDSEELLNKAQECNASFDQPLPASEVLAITRSIEKYLLRRSSKRTSPAFLERQSRRGRIGGRRSGAVRASANESKRMKAFDLSAQGLSSREIAADLDVHQSTVVRWLNS